MLKKYLLAALAAMSVPAATLAEPIPVEVIGGLPGFANPKISPDGHYVATRMTARGAPVVVVQPIHTTGGDAAKPSFIGVGERQLSWYDWANDNRLIIGIRATAGYRGQLFNLERMASINRQGTDARYFKMQPNDYGFYRQYAYVENWLPDDPDHILAVLDDEPNEWAEPRVHKVNINTGERELAAANQKGFFEWVSDRQGNLRVGVRYGLSRKNSDVEVYYRETVDSDWELLQEVDYFDSDRLIPYAFDKEDPNILLFTTREDANDFDYYEDMYRYDLQQRKVLGPYVNERIKQAQDLVEKALPDGKIDIVSMNRDRTIGFFRHYSDVLSPEYYLLNLNQGKLDYIAAEYPALVDYKLAPMLEKSFLARDGFEVPVFLTMPLKAGDEPVPAVVMPHGGPWAHDEWGFDNYVQFLASRGYAVLQPQFRGSTGYGLEHEVAGYGEWGMAIQDDITDATRWAIDEGYIDPERICIVGHSFGGYAAAMGVIKEPDLYACAVSINGVLDLKKFLRSAKNMLFGNVNRKVWNDMKNAKPNSPYERAKEIVAPVLLIGGERDTVVPVKQHSKRMYKRLRKLGKTVQYTELPDGEHWRTNEANEKITLTAIEKFLAKHLVPD